METNEKEESQDEGNQTETKKEEIKQRRKKKNVFMHMKKPACCSFCPEVHDDRQNGGVETVPQVDCGPIKSSSVDEQTLLNKIRPVHYSEFLDNEG